MAENVGGTEKKPGAAEIASALSALRAKLDTQPSAVQSRGMQEFLSRVANGEELKSAVAGVIAQIDTSHAKAEEMEKEAKARQQAALGSTGPLPLSADDVARLGVLDRELGELRQKQERLDKTVVEKEKAMEDVFKQAFPGHDKSFKDTSAAELAKMFDGLSEEERRKRAQDLLPAAQELTNSYMAQLDCLHDQADRVVEKGKIQHGLQGETLKEQISEAQDIMASGKGSAELADHIDVASSLDKRVDEVTETLQECQKKQEIIEEHALEKVKEQGIAETKDIEAETKTTEATAEISDALAELEVQNRELCDEVLEEYCGLHDSTAAYAAKFRDGTITAEHIANNADLQEIKETLTEMHPEIMNAQERENTGREQPEPESRRNIMEQARDIGRSITQYHTPPEEGNAPSVPPERSGSGRGR